MELQNQMINFLIYGGIIAYFIGMFSFVKNNEDYLEDKYHITYVIVTIIPLIICAYLMIVNQNDKRMFKLFMMLIIILVCLLLFPFIYSIFEWIFGKMEIVHNFILEKILNIVVHKEINFVLYHTLNFILILILLIPFSIIYNLLFTSNSNSLINFIFFIPCLFSDFVKYIINDYNNTSTTVFVLLIIESILITLYILLPQLSNKLYPSSKSNTILKKPQLLVGQRIISDDKPFRNDSDEYYNIKKGSSQNKKKFSFSRYFNNFTDKYIMGIEEKEVIKQDELINVPYLENFSLSLWLTLNPPSGSRDQENEIFCVGDVTNSDRIGGYPRILYLGNGELKFIFMDTDTDSAIDENATFSTQIQFQKWNYIVVNYNNHKTDLFINGELVYSSFLSSILPSRRKIFLATSIGFDNNSEIHGAICNIQVFKTPLVKNEISRTYNDLKIKNPPIK